MRVLIVEDEIKLNQLIHDSLLKHSWTVTSCYAISEAKTHLTNAVFDVALIDLNLPDGSGIDLTAWLRKLNPRIGIIITTARDQLSDRLAGLEAGADDYVIKPFELEELVARCRALDRRLTDSAELNLGEFSFNPVTRYVTKGDQKIALTKLEWAVLEVLIAAKGGIVAKERLENSIYGHGGEVESNTVEVYVSRLRKKLDKQLIRTVRGEGYQLAAATE
jgi:two-component system OmpR family response regulator